MIRRRLRAACANDQGRLGRHNRDDAGFTLVELLIALIVFAFLMGTSVLVASTVEQVTSRISTTYTNVNGQLSLSTTLQRLVRSAVAPAPSSSGSVPVPAFTASTPPTPTSMVFYTNTGTGNGPVKVRVSCTVTPNTSSLCNKTLAKPGTPTHPKTNGKAVLKITEYFVTTSTVHHKCPFAVTSTTTCKWQSTGHTLATVRGVSNGKNGQALFVYAWRTPTSSTGAIHTVCFRKVTTTSTPTCKSTDTSEFGSGTCKAATSGGATFSNCKVGAIQEVSYDIQINITTSNLYGGSQAEDDTGVFSLSETSMLYNPTVG